MIDGVLLLVVLSAMGRPVVVVEVSVWCCEGSGVTVVVALPEKK